MCQGRAASTATPALPILHMSVGKHQSPVAGAELYQRRMLIICHHSRAPLAEVGIAIPTTLVCMMACWCPNVVCRCAIIANSPAAAAVMLFMKWFSDRGSTQFTNSIPAAASRRK